MSNFRIITIFIFGLLPTLSWSQTYYTFSLDKSAAKIRSSDDLWRGEQENLIFSLHSYESVLELRKDSIIQFSFAGDNNYKIFEVEDFEEQRIRLSEKSIIFDEKIVFDLCDYDTVREKIHPIQNKLKRDNRINRIRKNLQENRIKFNSLNYWLDSLNQGEDLSISIRFQNVSDEKIKFDSVVFNSKHLSIKYPTKSILQNQQDSLLLSIDSDCLLPMQYEEQILIYHNLDSVAIKIEVRFYVNSDDPKYSNLGKLIRSRILGDTVDLKQLEADISNYNTNEQQASAFLEKMGMDYEISSFTEMFFIDTLNENRFIILPNNAKHMELSNRLKKE